jgi:hypothetical protein
MKITLRFTAVFALATVTLLLPGLIFAQTCTNSFCPLAPSDGSKLGTLYQSTNLADFISRLFAAALSIGAILAVLRLAYAGYLYMTSEAFGQKTHAREVIGNAVLGLLLLLSIYLILYQINPDILKLNFLQNIKQVPAAGAQQSQSGNVTVKTCVAYDQFQNCTAYQ